MRILPLVLLALVGAASAADDDKDRIYRSNGTRSDGYVLAEGSEDVVLKFSESVVELLTMILRREIHHDLRSRAGGLLLQPAFRRFRRQLDYAEYGGAPLLGINGVCIIAHGSSSPKAIKNAIRVAAEFVDYRINELIAAAIATVKLDSGAEEGAAGPAVEEAHG